MLILDGIGYGAGSNRLRDREFAITIQLSSIRRKDDQIQGLKILSLRTTAAPVIRISKSKSVSSSTHDFLVAGLTLQIQTMSWTGMRSSKTSRFSCTRRDRALSPPME